MITPKAQFLKKTELAARLRDVVTSTWFQECLTYARAEMIGVSSSIDALKGATKFEEILLDLPFDVEEQPPNDHGLNHDIDAPGKKRGETRKNK